jgi:hypothetical protein
MEFVRKTVWQMAEEMVVRYPERDALLHREQGLRCDYRGLGAEVEQRPHEG